VAIGSLLHTDDNSHLEIVRYAEGSGFLKLPFAYFSRKNAGARFVNMDTTTAKISFELLKIYFRNSWSKVLPFVMQSIDSTLKFKNNFLEECLPI
jgi:cholesterol oxidase